MKAMGGSRRRWGTRERKGLLSSPSLPSFHGWNTLLLSTISFRKHVLFQNKFQKHLGKFIVLKEMYEKPSVF